MAEEPVEPTTIYDLTERARVELRRLPRLFTTAKRLVWRAARLEALLVLGLQILAGPVVLVQLLLAGRGLKELLRQSHPGGSLAAVLPWLLLTGLVWAVSMASSSVLQDRQLVLGEEVLRRMETDVLQVT